MASGCSQMKKAAMSEQTFEKLMRHYFPFGFPTTLEAGHRLDLLPLVAAADPDRAHTGIQEVRELAHHLNLRKASGTYHPAPIQAEQLLALGLIADSMRCIAFHHCHRENPEVLTRGRRRVADLLGDQSIRKVPVEFVRLYPPREVVRSLPRDVASVHGLETHEDFRKRTREYIPRTTAGFSNRDLVDIEIILLYITMRNPATKPLRELFDDAELQNRAPYLPYVVSLEEFFEEQAPLGRYGQTLFHILRAPIHAAPHSLEDQLRYIREHWGSYLPEHIMGRITLALDISEEDRRLRGDGPGPVPVLEFRRDPGIAEERESEAFTADRDWMSNVVLMAKNVHVWLGQLSKEHGRPMTLLSDIPDEELDRLSRWGFQGLWLIGLWERSHSSQKIKRYMGNPEAAASAYSLAEYEIAGDLGGETAFRNLRKRAWQRGIRLASDMVPNHMGIDSRWVMEHPHWFIQLEQPAYPWYTYSGGNLSDNPQVGIYIEDGYWEKRDAAVIFKRVDTHTGEVRYLYHGNDGTSMPWNDTAQLNFILPEVREGVIQTILHVARLFPIIRFDAAMTLAKRHYQRLWFPQPGDAGAIPSRAEHGMSKAEFDRHFPVEFWREVVDRLAVEAPDTLLMAEAFWLMEGYFVRTLGMHRVYNSAFMNMLKNEENQKYRQTIKNVLEFSPEVLKRFVNFMSNPDERTAVEQFGKGDKYFGVCMLMVTMPGLPMFGHGQVEGFAEKYGMEYRLAYWDEPVDEHLVRRHESEIFPLMSHRKLFSGMEEFALFDFVLPDGSVDENVFAYTNRAENERGFVLFNNVFDRTAGTIHTSTAINVGPADAPRLVRRNLVEALGLDVSDGCYYSFRDRKTGLEYLRAGRELADNGFHVQLDGYQWYAFLDWRERRDVDGRIGELWRRLKGMPVPDVSMALREIDLEPVLEPYALVVEAARQLAGSPAREEFQDRFRAKLADFLEAASAFSGFREERPDREEPEEATSVEETAVIDLDCLLRPEFALAEMGLEQADPAGSVRWFAWKDDPSLVRTLLISLAMRVAGRVDPPAERGDRRQRIEEWLLREKAVRVLAGPGGDRNGPHLEVLLAGIAAVRGGVLISDAVRSPGTQVTDLFSDPAAREYLGVHESRGVSWFNKERLEKLIQALVPVAILELRGEGEMTARSTGEIFDTADKIVAAASESGYRVVNLVKLLSP